MAQSVNLPGGCEELNSAAISWSLGNGVWVIGASSAFGCVRSAIFIFYNTL